MNKIDNTQLTSYLTCPRQYEYKYLKNLRKRDYGDDGGNIDLDFGSAIHEALERFTLTKGDMSKGVSIFEKEYVVPTPSEITGTRDLKNTEYGKELLFDYVEFYNANMQDWETVETEQVGEFDLGNGYMFQCKIDEVVRINGNLFAKDYKTTTTKQPNRFFGKFHLANQASGYVSYVKAKHGSCAGFIPVMLHMKHLKTKRSGVGPGLVTSFQYDIFNRTEEQLRDFKDDVVYKTNELSKCTRFTKNPEACSNYRGCEFKELCLACGDKSVEEVLYEEYDSKEYLK